MYSEMCVAEKRPTQVEEQLRIVSGNNCEIDRLLHELENRLTPVLQNEIPLPPTCTVAAKDAAPLVPLAANLRQEVAMSNDFCRRLNSILQRLEV